MPQKLDITEPPGKIIFEDNLAVGVRVIIFVFGLIPLLSAYSLAVRAQLFAHFNILVLLIVIGSSLIGLVFIAAAVLGPRRRFIFDLFNKTLNCEFKVPTSKLLWVERTYARDVKGIKVVRDSWTDGPDTFGIGIKTVKKEYSFGSFSTQQEAEKYKAKLDAWATQ